MRGKSDISFDLSEGTNVTIRVYNTSGRLERVITRNASLARGRQSISWDGRDGDGTVVGSGLYVIVVSSSDSQAEKIVAVVR